MSSFTITRARRIPRDWAEGAKQLAAFSSVCPVCGGYISKNWSVVKPLFPGRPLYDAQGRKRWWVHENCYQLVAEAYLRMEQRRNPSYFTTSDDISPEEQAAVDAGILEERCICGPGTTCLEHQGGWQRQ